MHPVRKKRLYIILGILSCVSVAVVLMLYALNQNINLFYTPNQLVTNSAPLDTNMRIGGLVKEGSLKESQEIENAPDIEFVVTDNLAEVKVLYSGIIPDLFREGQGIVATGKLRDTSTFIANEVLAKHDENYMPKEVQDALEEQGLMNHQQNQSTDTNAYDAYDASSYSTKKTAY